jgi:hypothetical protein
MRHQEIPRAIEIAGARSGLRLREVWHVGAQRGEDLVIRRKPDLDFTRPAEDSPQPLSTGSRRAPQLAR